MVPAHKPDVDNCTFAAYTMLVYIQCVDFQRFQGYDKVVGGRTVQSHVTVDEIWHKICECVCLHMCVCVCDALTLVCRCGD